MRRLPVVAGVVIGEGARIFITRRAKGQHLSGFWEFPGGKVEEGETSFQALHRELQEELAIVVKNADLWMQIQHDYSAMSIAMEVFMVTDYEGVPRGAEGQQGQWVEIGELCAESTEFLFPEANQAILAKLAALARPP